MRSLVVFGEGAGSGAVSGAWGATRVDGVRVRCGVVPAAAPAFDPDAPSSAGRVLVRVRAFSCNYRDKGMIHTVRALPAPRYSAIGSELVGEVVATGAGVDDLRPGDRVILDHHYTDGRADPATGVREGVATNQASRGLQVLARQKLMRVPDALPDDAAAGFSLGAQTAYSMVRRAGVRPGAAVLVTGATSNTSLFVLAALRAAGARAVALTGSGHLAPRLAAVGADEVVVMERGDERARGEAVAEAARAVGGFDAVVDPFFDLYAPSAVPAIRPFGTYVTCGLYGQNADAARRAGVASRLDGTALLHAALLHNVSLVGNCVGLRSDLEAALADYAAGRLATVVDSVFDADDSPARFLDRTYNDGARFGKVVFRLAA